MIRWVELGFDDDYYVLSVTYFCIVEIHDLGITTFSMALWECSLGLHNLVTIIATLIYKHDMLLLFTA